MTQTDDLLADYLEHFQWRVLQDALLEGTAGHWEHRATTLDAARPRPGDYTGHATPDQLATADQALAASAAACRRHARFLRAYGLDEATHQAIARITGIRDMSSHTEPAAS